MRYYDDELYHYGRLGMKWGKHIFGRKKDSTPVNNTPPTKKAVVKDINQFRKSRGYKASQKSRYKWLEPESGVKLGKEYDTIDKGSMFYRYSTAKKEDHSKRLYASPSESDRYEYAQSARDGALWNKFGDDIYLHELQSTKQMKVAHGQDVVNYITEKYGDKSTKSAIRFMKDTKHPLEPYATYEYTEKYKGSKAAEYANKRIKAGEDFIKKSMKNESITNDTFRHFSKKGYDAIHDPEDNYLGAGRFEYPVIILNPKKSVKTKRVTRD